MRTETDRRFWVNWNPNHGIPTCRHDSKARAVAEAERLASAHKAEFITLEAVSVSRPVSVVTMPLPNRDPDIPF